MRTKKYWENRYNDFCEKILGKEIDYCRFDIDEIKKEMTRMEEFYKENTENGELTPEEIILYCNINHELNLLDPIGCCYPQISNEYSSYAWKLVEHSLVGEREQFPQKVREQIESLVFTLGNQDVRTARTTSHRIIEVVANIYDSYDSIKDLHQEHISEGVFWRKQLNKFLYKVLGELRKEYAASLTFLREERDDLLEHKEENMKENYEGFIQFLYINHHLNRLDPARMYYPQFRNQYEKYAWIMLKIYKGGSDFPVEAEKIIVKMYQDEGSTAKREFQSIRLHIEDMKRQLDKMNKY